MRKDGKFVEEDFLKAAEYHFTRYMQLSSMNYSLQESVTNTFLRELKRIGKSGNGKANILMNSKPSIVQLEISKGLYKAGKTHKSFSATQIAVKMQYIIDGVEKTEYPVFEATVNPFMSWKICGFANENPSFYIKK